MKAKPLSNRVVVKPVVEEKQTPGGIIIPDNVATNKSNQAIILAVGPGHKNKEGNIVSMTVSVNDRVVISKDAGHKVTIDGEDLVIVTEDDIFAIIED